MRPVRWIMVSGNTTAGGRLLRGCVSVLATAAIEGQSLGLGAVVAKAGGNMRSAAEHQHVAGRMLRLRMRQRTDQGPMLAALGQQRQMLADLNAGRARGNGVEFAADRVRGVGLHVEAVVLGQPTGEEDVNHRLGLRRFGGDAAGGRHGSQGLDMVHSQAKQADRAGLYGRASRNRWVRRNEAIHRVLRSLESELAARPTSGRQHIRRDVCVTIAKFPA